MQGNKIIKSLGNLGGDITDKFEGIFGELVRLS